MALNVDVNFGKAIARHIVSLQWVDRTPGERLAANEGAGTPQATSGFVVAIQSHWFLITAGHILKDIEDARSNGQLLEDFRLADGYANPLSTFEPFLFPFDDAIKHYFLAEEPKVDYGVIHLRPNYQSLLHANGIVALGEHAWRDDLPDTFDEVLLAGLPSQYVSHRGNVRGVVQRTTLVVVGLDPCGDAIPSISEDDGRLIYKLPLPTPGHGYQLSSVDGMSGCPLFGVQHGSAKEHRYWVIGVQSAEIKENGIARYVLACPFEPLGEFLEQVLSKLDAHQSTE